MDTNLNTTAAAQSTTAPGQEVSGVILPIPDYSNMSISQLRLYFQILRTWTDTLNAQSARDLSEGPESQVSEWMDGAFSAVDTLTADLMQHLQTRKADGAAEKFRLCMLIEHDAWLGESIENIARTIRTALLPIPGDA